MPRHYKAHEHQRRAKALRDQALQRNELRQPSEERESAAGATSFPVKKIDMDSARAIEAFLQRQKA
jgi:hypothetical protein